MKPVILIPSKTSDSPQHKINNLMPLLGYFAFLFPLSPKKGELLLN